MRQKLRKNHSVQLGEVNIVILHADIAGRTLDAALEVGALLT